jgi:hypothetical protein
MGSSPLCKRTFEGTTAAGLPVIVQSTQRQAARDVGERTWRRRQGAVGQWQSSPFPLRLAGIFLAGMAALWLTRWLGGVSILVAVLL